MLRAKTSSKVDLISRAPLFAGLSRRELARVAALADEIDLPAGKALMREGERGREFFVLLEGEVDVTRGGEHVATLGAGDFFGEIALLSPRPRIATVTTGSPVRALVLTDRAFRGLVHESPQIALDVLEAVAERLPHDEP